MENKPKRKRAPRRAITQIVEVCRSFSFKLNVGNYESRDFFCSEKAECPMDKAPEVSRALYDFCKSEVMTAVRAYHRERKAHVAGEIINTHPVAAANAREFENRRLVRAEQETEPTQAELDAMEPLGGWQGAMGTKKVEDIAS